MKSIKYYWRVLIFVFAIVSVFTALDVLTHSLSDSFAVPEYYFPHKILFSTAMGFFLYLFTTGMKPFSRALVFSGIIAILLQINYFRLGYPNWFVFGFLVSHFVDLVIPAYVGFRLSEKYKLVR